MSGHRGVPRDFRTLAHEARAAGWHIHPLRGGHMIWRAPSGARIYSSSSPSLMRGLCPVCHHSQRGVIDEHLSGGRDVRSLADEYGVDTRALRCHRDDHVRSTGLARGRRSAARLRT